MKKLLPLLISLFFVHPVLFAADPPKTQGNSSGGGGNVVTGATGPALADQRFQATEYEDYTLSSEVAADLADIRLELYNLFPKLHWNREGETKDFWEKEVYGKFIEYRVVEKLPENCRFVEAQNIQLRAGEKNQRAACTFGDITYLLKSVVKEFEDKKLFLDFALLIFHERLVAFTQNTQSYDVLSEYVQAVSLVMKNYAPVRKAFVKDHTDYCKAKKEASNCAWPLVDSHWVQNPPLIFNAQELKIINKFLLRHQQLTKLEISSSAPQGTITSYGGKYLDSSIGTKNILGLGTILKSVKLEGEGIRIINTLMNHSRVAGNQNIIIGGPKAFDKFNLPLHYENLDIQGDNVNVLFSKIKDLNIRASHVELSNVVWEYREYQHTVAIKGSHLKLLDSTFSDIGVYNPSVGKLEKILATDRLVIQKSTLDAFGRLREPSKPRPQLVPEGFIEYLVYEAEGKKPNAEIQCYRNNDVGLVRITLNGTTYEFTQSYRNSSYDRITEIYTESRRFHGTLKYIGDNTYVSNLAPYSYKLKVYASFNREISGDVDLIYDEDGAPTSFVFIYHNDQKELVRDTYKVGKLKKSILVNSR